MPHRPLTPASLARRFAVAAAALATAAVLLIALSSWWLVERQHEHAARELDRKEADFHAATVSRSLHALALRMSEVADSTILATGLVDSAGKETYLAPYLTSIRQVNGVPIDILFTDFEGKEISRNGETGFSEQELAWLRAQLERGRSGSTIFDGADGPELVAAELMNYARTPTPEGAVLYKVRLQDLQPIEQARLAWGGRPETDDAHVVRIDTPPIYGNLQLHLIDRHEPVLAASPLPQYVIILVLAGALAAAVYLIGKRLALALTADLRRLDAFARSVIEQGFGRQRAEGGGSDEVTGLARSINHMLDRLHEQHHLLQQETDKLHQLANTIPQLAWIAHPDGEIHWYNERWYAYIGGTPGAAQTALWHYTDAASAQQLRAAIIAGQPFQMTVPLRGADGLVRPFFTSAAPLRNADGRIVQWFGTNTDLSPIERAERAVRESEERLREGLIAARMVVWDWDLDSGAVLHSDNAVDVLGYVPPNVESAWETIHPDDREPLQAIVAKALEPGSGDAYERVLRIMPRHGGAEQHLWVEVRGRVLRNEQGRAIAVRGIMLDINQRKRAEDALVAANTRKDDFLAMLAHELRNPLAPISTAAQILQRIPVDAKVRELSDIIGRQSEHMNNLVDDLLDVSRVTRGLIKLDRETVPVDEIVAGAIEQVRGLLEARRHQWRIEADTGGACVHADRTRMVQVLANLLNNAAKYTPEGGHIAVQAAVEGQTVRLAVRDNGIGMTPELLPHVFELFIQAERSPDRSQGGLGLGLTLVRSLTELHGGSVTAHSAGPGQGSEFVLTLPLASGTVPSAPLSPAASPAPAAPLRVMVVDDNADAALSLAMLLESAAGHQVSVEYDARRALARAEVELPQALLLDIGLPDMDGYELARRLRQLPGLRQAMLVAVTGYGQSDDRAQSRLAGFDHHLVKPVQIDALLQLLEQHARVGTQAVAASRG